jgi:hypothetical protein
MKKILLAICFFVSTSAFATTAFWTGNKQPVEAEAGQTKWNCEYRVGHTTQMILFWRIFPDSCPTEIDADA